MGWLALVLASLSLSLSTLIDDRGGEGGSLANFLQNHFFAERLLCKNCCVAAAELVREEVPEAAAAAEIENPAAGWQTCWLADSPCYSVMSEVVKVPQNGPLRQLCRA